MRASTIGTTEYVRSRREIAVGTRLAGRYRIESVLGQGGSSVVLAAHDDALRRRVAIKVLHGCAGEPAGRMLREARICAQLRSEHLVQVFDVGSLPDGAPFLVMECLQGEDLAAVVARGPIEVPRAIDYVQQACIAVTLAHAGGTLHRDLKPANLFLVRAQDRDVIKVLDFGMSKPMQGVAEIDTLTATESGTVLGTPAYMAPEQLLGTRHLDARIDVWALGVILYELVTGTRPFVGESFGALAVAIATGAPRDPLQLRPDLPLGLVAVLRRCLEKAPDQRISTVSELSAALSRCLRDDPIEGGTDELQRFSHERVVDPTVGFSTLPDLGALVGRRAALASLRDELSDTSRPVRVLLVGDPGVGKTHVATAFGAAHCGRYAGGTFFVPFDSDPAVFLARLTPPRSEERVEERARRALSEMTRPTLLIFDNVPDHHVLQRWLPPAALPVHVLVTTTMRFWPREERSLSVNVLDAEEFDELAARILGRDISREFIEYLTALAQGNTVQFIAAAKSLDYELRHGRAPRLREGLAPETISSFERSFRTLTDDAREFCRAAALFAGAAIPVDAVANILEWSEERVQRALDVASDRSLVLCVGSALRMHQLMAAFLNAISEPALSEACRTRHWSAFLAAAAAFCEQPADLGLRARFAAYRADIEFWQSLDVPFDQSEILPVGGALAELGRFAEAKEWFARAAEGSSPEVDASERRGRALQAVGWCIKAEGNVQGALPWFEMAVAVKQRDVESGRADRASLGMSLCCMADAQLRVGNVRLARGACERALGILPEVGDGDVDYAQLRGTVLHTLGECLSRESDFREAAECFSSALRDKLQADRTGRLNWERVGRSLHGLGDCYAQLDELAMAHDYFARAAAAKERGDQHGRVDGSSVSASWQADGEVLLALGHPEDAQSCFERASASKKLGDVYGREATAASNHGDVPLCRWYRSPAR